jgi:Asp-tRNA(Asn)/Glu-tRNA(Gln) amidotransferase A subunit family amidase
MKGSALRSYVAASSKFVHGIDSPRSFLERCIETITEKEARVGAFAALNLEAAREAANEATQRWRQGRQRSSIDGMPIGVKDIMETADMPTQQGSALFDGWHGHRDAAAVVALREAGALILGKTVTTEFASTEPGRTRNPLDLERTPGGSSSGSAAAVAAGFVPAALGTQVFGSIIRPASFCGCFGFKPSVGAINRGGSFDGFSQSCTGVIAATLEESWMVARAISARAGGDPGYGGLSGPLAPPAARLPRRVAVLETVGWGRPDEASMRALAEARELRGVSAPDQNGAGATDEAKEALRQARERLAAAGIALMDRDSDDAVAAVESTIAAASRLTTGINAWEGRWPLNTYARDLDRSRMTPAALRRLGRGEEMTLEQYQVLLEERQRVRDCYEALQRHCDACITLSAGGAAPLGIKWTGDPIFAVPGSLLGVPALSLPVLNAEGLPLGLQVLGFKDRDAALFEVGAGLLGLFGT